jgi:hypothetical protein
MQQMKQTNLFKDLILSNLWKETILVDISIYLWLSFLVLCFISKN